jgi:hypothetical protein
MPTAQRSIDDGHNFNAVPTVQYVTVIFFKL